MASGYSLNINDVLIKTAEHLYQAMRFPLHPHIQHEILSQHSPMTAKMVSKKYSDKYTRADWNEVRFKIMQWVLEVKLYQNYTNFSQLLLQTANKPIVEYTPKDKIWGAVIEGDMLIGTNALGRLLMQLRDNFVINNNALQCIEPLAIPDFLLYDFPIEKVCNSNYEYELLACEDTEYDFA